MPKKEKPEWAWRFDAMFDELVPPSGEAPTVQGELVRAIERLAGEASRNGNASWDESYAALLAYIGTVLRDETRLADAAATAGSPVLNKRQLGQLKRALDRIADYDRPETKSGGAFDSLRKLAVLWCSSNRDLIVRPGSGAPEGELAGRPIAAFDLTEEPPPRHYRRFPPNNDIDLLIAAAHGLSEELQERLVQGGNVNSTMDHFDSPLISAAEQRRVSAVKLLLQHGADPRIADNTGRTALHYAVELCESELVDLLVSADSEVDAINEFGHTPLSLALCGEDNTVPALVSTLLAHGADPQLLPDNSWESWESDHVCQMLRAATGE